MSAYVEKMPVDENLLELAKKIVEKTISVALEKTANDKFEPTETIEKNTVQYDKPN